MTAWVTWSPPWAPAVSGRYEAERVEQQDGAVGQRWEVRCVECGAGHQGTCGTGAVRANIAKFAVLHVHEKRGQKQPLAGREKKELP